MMKRIFGLSIVILGMMAICTPAVPALDEQGAGAEENKILTLEHIKANPDSMKATVITFRGQFHTFNEVYSPFYTPFNSTTHLNFSAWEYDAPLWVKEAFKRDFPYIYVDKRNHELCGEILKYKTYMRFEASGTIRSTFNNIPWIQITSIKKRPKALNRTTLAHMARGYHYLSKEKYLSGVLEFSQAYSKDLPVPVQGLIRKEEGKALFKIGSYAEAVDVLEKAIRLFGKKTEDLELEFLLKEAIAMTAYEERLAEEAEEWEENRPQPTPIWDDEEESEEEAEAEEVEVEEVEPQPDEEKWIEAGEVIIDEAEEVVNPVVDRYDEDNFEEIDSDEVLEEIDS